LPSCQTGEKLFAAGKAGTVTSFDGFDESGGIQHFFGGDIVFACLIFLMVPLHVSHRQPQ
jgi:hypothetical protein